MNLVEFYREKYDRITNPRLDREARLKALSDVVDYISGMKEASQYMLAIINVLIDAFENGTDEELIVQYMEELSKELDYSSSSKISIVLSEENYLAETLRKLYSEHIQFISLSKVNDAYAQYYDYYIKCGEKNIIDNSGIQSLEKVHFLDLYLICFYGFLGYPMTWGVWSDYLRNVETCHTIITGMSYFREALNADLVSDGVCNISNSSQDIYYDYLCFKDALKRNPGIARLIIGLAPYSLRYDLSLVQREYERNRLFFYYGRFKDIHNNTTLLKEIKDYEQTSDEFKSIFGDDFEEKIYSKICDDYNIDDGRKERAVFNECDVTNEELKQMQGKYNKPYEATFSENCKLMREYVQFALGNDCEVILFIPPYSQWYRNRWNPAYKEELLDFVNSLKDDLDIKLIDFSEMNLPDYYFGDYAHLNRLGAGYTIKELKRHIQDLDERVL